MTPRVFYVPGYEFADVRDIDDAGALLIAVDALEINEINADDSIGGHHKEVNVRRINEVDSLDPLTMTVDEARALGEALRVVLADVDAKSRGEA